MVADPTYLQNDLGFGAFSFSGDSVLCATTTTVVEHSPVSALSISPNPADDFAVLHLTAPLGAQDRVDLFDAQGRLVQSSRSVGTSMVLVRNGLPAGVYNVRVLRANGNRQLVRLAWR